jgi:NAD-dependent dihydropyrimidine dehydrogenase PreA subunit
MARVLLRFGEDIVDRPITAEVILEHRVPLSIVSAHIDSLGGEILIEIPSTHVEKIVEAFREKGVSVTIPELITVDDDKCFDCGACQSLCPVNAILFTDDFSVVFDERKCIGSSCGLCINACPARAIHLIEPYGHNLK